MKILVILGHPKTGSFNHAIAETAILIGLSLFLILTVIVTYKDIVRLIA